MRFFWTRKTAEMHMFPVNLNSGSPSLVDFPYAKKPGSGVFLWFSSVLAINAGWCIAQVRKFVVGLYAVDMVNVMLRPFASHIEPRQPVRGVNGVINANAYVAVSPKAANPSFGFGKRGSSKKPRLCIVMQKLFQAALRQCRIQSAHLSFLNNDGSGSDAKGRKPLGIAHYSRGLSFPP